MTDDTKQFKCPECGGEEFGGIIHRDPPLNDLEVMAEFDWRRAILIICASCSATVSKHLAYRADGMTFDDARRLSNLRMAFSSRIIAAVTPAGQSVIVPSPYFVPPGC